MARGWWQCLVLFLALAMVQGQGSSYVWGFDDALGDEAASDYAIGMEGENLFDLHRFQVSSEREGSILFTFELVNLPNPLQLPLGFSYPLIHVYIHPGGPGSWRVHTPPHARRSPLSNPGVALDPRYYWVHMVGALPQP